MSENTTIKLNLKALKKEDWELSEKTDVPLELQKQEKGIIKSSLGEEENLEENSTNFDSNMETKELAEVWTSEEKEEKSFKISLWDIKKSKEEKINHEELIWEEKKSEKKEITWDSSESKIKQKSSGTQEESIIEEKNITQKQAENPENFQEDENKIWNKNNISSENIANEKVKKDINTAFKEEVLSDKEQDEIIQKTLGKDKWEEPKKWKKLFDFFKRSKKNNEESNKVEENQEIKDEEIHFNNYISVFETQSQNLLKRIQNFKYAPQTRVWFVLSLIISTVLIISGLMVFFPEKHNMEVYQASILNIVWKETGVKNTSSTNNNLEKDILPQNNKTDTEMISEDKISKEEKEKKQIKNYILNKYNSQK